MFNLKATSTRTFALRDATQMARVPEHVVKSDFRYARELLLPNLAVRDRPAPRIQPCDNRTYTTKVKPQRLHSNDRTHFGTRQGQQPQLS